MLLLIEYLPEHGCSSVVRIRQDGTLDEDYEFIFAQDEKLVAFVRAYQYNPIAAIYAYMVLLGEIIDEDVSLEAIAGMPT